MKFSVPGRVRVHIITVKNKGQWPSSFWRTCPFRNISLSSRKYRRNLQPFKKGFRFFTWYPLKRFSGLRYMYDCLRQMWGLLWEISSALGYCSRYADSQGSGRCCIWLFRQWKQLFRTCRCGFCKSEGLRWICNIAVRQLLCWHLKLCHPKGWHFFTADDRHKCRICLHLFN